MAPDGRVLAVVEGGCANGKPVFYLHGTPVSRMLYGPHQTDAEKRGIRLIGYDRPGYGGSSSMPGRRVSDVASDVALIADHLHLERFALWGFSGGAPHAIACASLLPDRVVAAAALASSAPYPSPGLDWLGGLGEDDARNWRAVMARGAKLDAAFRQAREGLLRVNPVEFSKAFESSLSAMDRMVLTGELAEFFAASTREGIRPGHEGWMEDNLALVSDWGFSPSDVSTPLLLWHGRQDKMIPFSHGQWLAEHIPNVEKRLSTGDGHLTLFQNRIPETHAWLLNRF